ncbi:MAG: mandelate racemase/muconate lactonizing enzyme family protein [Polyangiaceae bacterium]
MASLTPRCGPGDLASLLEGLTVRISSLHVQREDVSLPDYPGGPRPSSVVHVSGNGVTGKGEFVAFYDAEHVEFAAAMQAWFESNRARTNLRVGSALGSEGTPYARAALQAALIDLGLRQAGLSLYDLTGVRETGLRFVVSLAADPEPLSAITRVRAAGFSGGLKIDVEPAWNHATLAQLAGDPSIVIFDFKGKGDVALAQCLAALNDRAWFEDPPPGFDTKMRARLARDASLPDASSVALARAGGEAVNLKAPRMGGPLEVLRSLEQALASRADSTPVLAYLGGMFEVSVGRAQARELAALYCATGPNDLAANVAHPQLGARADSPLLVQLDKPGFGSSDAG